MTKYSKTKFQQLSDQRKAQVLLQHLNEAEENWSSAPSLKEIKSYIEWIQPGTDLVRLKSLIKKMSTGCSRRHLLNIIVPIERYLNRQVKETELNIQNQDFKNTKQQKYPLFVILDHLRSSLNVGSIFRSAECMGAAHIYLVGYTPTPEDLGVQKTAMGTEKLVSWSQHDRIEEVLEKLKLENIPVVALETSQQSEDLGEFQCPDKVAILLGNERFGLEAQVVKACEHLVQISMAGAKNSLNVANTFSIVAYELTKQLKQRGRVD